MVWIDHDGYVRISTKNGYVKEHRYVYEQYFKCCLLDYTILHHKNGNRSDNRIENLEPLYHAQHESRHKKDKSNRLCLICNRKTYVFKDGRESWQTNPITGERWICLVCYNDIMAVMRFTRRHSSFSSVCNELYTTK